MDNHAATDPDVPQDIDWSEAPIAKMYGTRNTRFDSIEFNRCQPLETPQ